MLLKLKYLLKIYSEKIPINSAFLVGCSFYLFIYLLWKEWIHIANLRKFLGTG